MVDDMLSDDKRAPCPKIRVLSVAPLLADAIRRIHQDASVSELFETFW